MFATSTPVSVLNIKRSSMYATVKTFPCVGFQGKKHSLNLIGQNLILGNFLAEVLEEGFLDIRDSYKRNSGLWVAITHAPRLCPLR